MDKLEKTFVKGNVLKAEELNELVDKINELVGGSLIIGDTAGTAYDGAAGAALEQIVRELTGVPELCIAYMYAIICLLLASPLNMEKSVSLILPLSPSIGMI